MPHDRYTDTARKNLQIAAPEAETQWVEMVSLWMTVGIFDSRG